MKEYLIEMLISAGGFSLIAGIVARFAKKKFDNFTEGLYYKIQEETNTIANVIENTTASDLEEKATSKHKQLIRAGISEAWLQVKDRKDIKSHQDLQNLINNKTYSILKKLTKKTKTEFDDKFLEIFFSRELVKMDRDGDINLDSVVKKKLDIKMSKAKKETQKPLDTISNTTVLKKK